MMDYILFKNLDGKYLTLKDCIEANKPEEAEKEEVKAEEPEATEDQAATEEKEKDPTVIYYVTDELQQSQYINMFRAEGKDAVILKHNIDTAFISHVEQKEEDVKFQRIDADLTDSFKEENAGDLEEANKALSELFQKTLKKEKLTVKAEKLKNESISSVMTLSEESRRMQDMMKMYGMMDMGMMGGDETLVSIRIILFFLISLNMRMENTGMICEQLYDLALMGQRQVTPEEMTRFVERSNQVMLLLTK